LRDANSRLIEAIVGVLLAAVLLLAAFSVIAQEPNVTAPAQERTQPRIAP
jgi:Tfp pilus assembly protein PilV